MNFVAVSSICIKESALASRIENFPLFAAVYLPPKFIYTAPFPIWNIYSSFKP